MARFRKIIANDLRSNDALAELFIEAVTKNWWPNTNPDVLEFFCLAEKALGSHHSIVVQCMMPKVRLPPEQRRFESRHGRAMLVIDAGTIIRSDCDEIKNCPLPYGTKLRLLLPYINGYALRHRTREVCMGGSLRKFMGMLGIGWDGPRGKEVVRQLEALAACQITIHAWLADQRVTKAGRISNTFRFWRKRDHRGTTVWQPSMTLTTEYYESLQDHQVPISMHHLHQLTHSARRMDIYTFLSYRTQRLNGNRPAAIRVATIHELFGREILAKHHFCARLRQDLKAIYKIHPFNVEIEGDMLILRKSRLPVNPLTR